MVIACSLSVSISSLFTFWINENYSVITVFIFGYRFRGMGLISYLFEFSTTCIHISFDFINFSPEIFSRFWRSKSPNECFTVVHKVFILWAKTFCNFFFILNLKIPQIYCLSMVSIAIPKDGFNHTSRPNTRYVLFILLLVVVPYSLV